MLAAVLAAELLAAGILLGSQPAPRPVIAPSPEAPADVVGASRHLSPVSLGGARTDALLTRVQTGLGAAVTDVERFWGVDWPREVVVVATDSEAQFAQWANLDPRLRWSDIAAVSVADDVDLTRRRASGQRIVLAPGAAAMSDAALRIVLAHELFHYAARADTALDAPHWLTEGVADFVARPPAPLPRGAGNDVDLPSDTDVDGVGPDRSTGYDRAWWFARFVADTYGPDALRQLYVRACGPGHGDFATAVHQALGTDIAELQARWAMWLNR